MVREVFTYNSKKYDFKKIITDLFDSGPLDKLHEVYSHPNIFTMSDNSDTIFHDMFYQDMRKEGPFVNLYRHFINTHLRKMMGVDFVYQASPTLRVHLHGNWATPEFHVDTQDGYNHPPGEINFILPLTPCYGNNSVWVESSPGNKVYSPIEMGVGDIFGFSGGELMHGNRINDTGVSRVSFDFRIIPKEQYNDKYKKTSATRGTKFIVGHYYRELE